VSAGVRVRLILADGGDFLVHEVSIPADSLNGYDRLIDCLREDPAVLKGLHVDPLRLVAAELLQD
jgi:hypothetical protein